jgi:hypothetical protein
MYQISMTGSVAPITTNKMMGSLHDKQQSPHDLENPAICNGLQSVDRYIGNTRQLPKMNQKSVASDVLYNVIWTHKFTIFTRFVGG